MVETGEFGSDMKVSLLNDGPFTIILDEQRYSESWRWLSFFVFAVLYVYMQKGKSL